MHTHLALVYEGCDSCGVLKSTDFCFYFEGTLELVSVGMYFFVKLSDGRVVGCSVEKQVQFLEWEEIMADFWDH